MADFSTSQGAEGGRDNDCSEIFIRRGSNGETDGNGGRHDNSWSALVMVQVFRLMNAAAVVDAVAAFDGSTVVEQMRVGVELWRWRGKVL